MWAKLRFHILKGCGDESWKVILSTGRSPVKEKQSSYRTIFFFSLWRLCVEQPYPPLVISSLTHIFYHYTKAAQQRNSAYKLYTNEVHTMLHLVKMNFPMHTNHLGGLVKMPSIKGLAFSIPNKLRSEALNHWTWLLRSPHHHSRVHLILLPSSFQRPVKDYGPF